MIVLHTSAILGLEDRRDHYHRVAVKTLEGAAGPAIIPMGILAEVDHMLTGRVRGAMDRVLDAFIDGSVLLDCGDLDLPRIKDLMSRYAELPLGFSDAAVVACAERNGGQVMTFDRRDFDVVARDVAITVVP